AVRLAGLRAVPVDRARPRARQRGDLRGQGARDAGEPRAAGQGGRQGGAPPRPADLQRPVRRGRAARRRPRRRMGRRARRVTPNGLLRQAAMLAQALKETYTADNGISDLRPSLMAYDGHGNRLVAVALQTVDPATIGTVAIAVTAAWQPWALVF